MCGLLGYIILYIETFSKKYNPPSYMVTHDYYNEVICDYHLNVINGYE